MADTQHSSGLLKDIFMHAAILIPIEFGLLHATFLGPMITSGFQDMFTALGLNELTGAAQIVGDELTIF